MGRAGVRGKRACMGGWGMCGQEGGGEGVRGPGGWGGGVGVRGGHGLGDRRAPVVRLWG